jgi:hypothetical protein
VTDNEVDSFVPDSVVRAELGGITSTTMRRWEQKPSLNFPPPIRINERTYRSRRALEAFKTEAIRRGAVSAEPRGKAHEKARKKLEVPRRGEGSPGT